MDGGLNSDYVKMRFTPSISNGFRGNSIKIGVLFISADDSPYVFFTGGYEFTAVENWKAQTISKKQATYLYTDP